MNQRYWSMPLELLSKGVLRCRLKVWSVLDECSESGREFQILGAAVRKEREPKIRLVRGTFKRFEEEDENTRRTVRNKKT